MPEADLDPRLARLARIAAERLRLDASLGHTHFVPTRVAKDAVLPEREVPRDAYTDAQSPAVAEAEAVHEPPATGQPIGETGAAAKMQAITPVREEAWACRRCGLCEDRTHVVFGEGSLDTDIVFVGEAPGADEDAQGLPFVGRAGQLLTRMIEGGLKRPRGSVYICNILKCRPPGNRNPHPDEVGFCLPYLRQQLAIIRPSVICALGRIAANALLDNDESLGRLRGQWHDVDGMPLIATYHPSYLLRQRGPDGSRSEADYKAWDDLKMIIQRLNG